MDHTVGLHVFYGKKKKKKELELEIMHYIVDR